MGGGDKAIISEIERGEDYLKEEFDRVRNDDALSASILDVVNRAYASVTSGHTAISGLKHELAG